MAQQWYVNNATLLDTFIIGENDKAKNCFVVELNAQKTTRVR